MGLIATMTIGVLFWMLPGTITHVFHSTHDSLWLNGLNKEAHALLWDNYVEAEASEVELVRLSKIAVRTIVLWPAIVFEYLYYLGGETCVNYTILDQIKEQQR